jgi:predicted Zn-ribbon and HTH transcriptional regulator
MAEDTKIPIKLPKCICLKCDYEWTPRVSDPRMCPKCRTLRWDEPKRDGNGHKGVDNA